MKKTIYSLLVVAALLSACKKPINCSNAQLCIQNKSGRVVHFDWNGGAGQYNDSIMPNASACKNVGQVTVNNTTTSTPTTYFYSDRGNYAITVSECNQSQIIN
jgi:hypothetical protein